MSGGACLSDTHQRARGELLIAVKRRGEASVISDLRQSGCLKARFPRPIVPFWLDATMLNSSGGVAGGDQLDTTISVEAGAHATIAAQAAERFYRALPDSKPSRVRTKISVATGAAAEWLPQETILFDRSALNRHLTIDLAPDASFLGVEILIFGRAAMGETVTQIRLRDTIELHRAGEIVLRDAIRLDGDAAAILARTAGGARVVATLIYAAPDAATRLDAVRAAGDFASSAWNGILLTRFLGPDGAAVRRDVMTVLDVLRDGRPVPRVWLC